MATMEQSRVARFEKAGTPHQTTADKPNFPHAGAIECCIFMDKFSQPRRTQAGPAGNPVRRSALHNGLPKAGEGGGGREMKG